MAVRDIVQAAAGVGGAGEGVYVEDVFSTYLYTGTGATQHINNGIALGDSSPATSALFSLGDIVSFPSGVTALNIGTGDFTVEAFVKVSDTDAGVFAYNGSVSGSFMFGPRGFGRSAVAWDSANPTLTGGWDHLAVSRESGTARLYLNGTLLSTNTGYTHSFDFNNYNCGYNSGGNGLVGNVSNLRVSNIARYTGASLTVPTEDLTSDADTLLLVFSGASVFQDQSSYSLTVTNTGAVADVGPLGSTEAGYGQGGLVWTKARNSATESPVVVDTERGVLNALYTNYSIAQTSLSNSLTAFNSNGYSVSTRDDWNKSGNTYASWTFRKAPKFFDVVTYTGNGSSIDVSHNLGSTPGFVIVKSTSGTTPWTVWHRSLSSGQYLVLNTNAATANAGQVWLAESSSEITLSGAYVNSSGQTYVAYLFAHDAGGFGDVGEQNVFSCGVYTGSNTVQTTVNLGYEPQFVLIKNVTTGGNNWAMFDNMRGVATGGVDAQLIPNSSGAEVNTTDWLSFTSTGFQLIPLNNGTVNRDANNYIYIAIRRGPMKTPESGTEVFAPVTWSGPTSVTFNNFAPDMATRMQRNAYNSDTPLLGNRLTGGGYLNTTNTNAFAVDTTFKWDLNQNGASVDFGATTNLVSYFFRRAPSFMDVVAYTGTGSARTVAHNLGVAPELMIIKSRNLDRDWRVYYGVNTAALRLDSTAAPTTSSAFWNNTSPTSSVFTVGTDVDVNNNTTTYVAYLFATLPGISKIGTYTGTGTTLQIDCGFSSGARFVLIRRLASSSDWYVWDSARGIVSGNDPYLRLNSTAAEVTSTDYIDPLASGFTVTSSAPAALNASGGTYIFLAIA